MKLLYVADAKFPALAANTVQVMKMCAAFAAAGAEVTLLARPEGVELGRIAGVGAWPPGIADYYGVPQSFRLTRARRLVPGRSKRDTWNAVFSISSLVWLLRRRKDFDVLYTRLPLLALLAALCKIPVVYEAHQLLARDDRWSVKLSQALVKAQSRSNFLGTVVISHSLKTFYEQEGFDATKIIVAHDAVDLERFQPPLSQVEARRSVREFPRNLPQEAVNQADLLDDTKIVGYVGHLYSGRGIPELLTCAERHPEWTFLFVGGNEGDLKTHCSTVEQRGIKNAHFMGFVPNAQLAPFLFACDVLTMPYTSGTGSVQFMSPMKMFEYMATGRAIAAADWPPLREVLRHEHNALLFAPDNIDTLDAALARLMSDETLRLRLAAQAMQDVQQYTWANRARTIVEWIESKLKAHQF